MRLLRIASMVALLVLACWPVAAQSEADPPADEPATMTLGQPFELALGDTQTVAETGLQLTFVHVPEDSRCAIDVQCIWAGRVAVELDAQAPGEQPESLRLATNTDAQTTYAGQTIELQEVAPGPGRAGQPVPEQDYRITLLVS